MDNYAIYDRQGREIEYATYGEVSEKYGKTEDGQAVISDSWDNFKIFTSDFTTYNYNGRRSKMETWLYHDNVKSEFWNYRVYQYNDDGSLVKETQFTAKNVKEKTVTYTYDKQLNNIEIVDSTFNGYLTAKQSVSRTENKFDTLNRIVLTTMFSDGKFLLNKKFLYDNGTTTELRYDNKNAITPWLATVTKTGEIAQYPHPVKTLEVSSKITGSAETIEIYLYNADGLLEKIETYSKGELTQTTSFKYKFY